jgi:hypothetical protein
MTGESEKSESALPEKLLIDNPSDFQFHAAYLAYSDAFEKSSSPEAKRQLNQNISGLQQGQVDYSTFYRNIDQYRTGMGFQQNYGRTIIRTQKKREWRRTTQKQERIKRHKK